MVFIRSADNLENQLKKENDQLQQQLEHLTEKLSLTLKRFQSESSALGQCLTNQTLLNQALQDVEQQLEIALQQNLHISSAHNICKTRLQKKVSLIATVRQQRDRSVSNLTAQVETQKAKCAAEVEKMQTELTDNIHSQQLETDILRQTLRTSNFSFMALVSTLQHNHSQEISLLTEQAQANYTILHVQVQQARRKEIQLKEQLRVAINNKDMFAENVRANYTDTQAQLQQTLEREIQLKAQVQRALEREVQLNSQVQTADKTIMTLNERKDKLTEAAQANYTIMQTQLQQALEREIQLNAQVQMADKEISVIKGENIEFATTLNKVRTYANKLEGELQNSTNCTQAFNKTNIALSTTLETVSTRAIHIEDKLRRNEDTQELNDDNMLNFTTNSSGTGLPQRIYIW